MLKLLRSTNSFRSDLKTFLFHSVSESYLLKLMNPESYLLKLMNSEDASCVAAVRAHLLSEAARQSGIADRQILRGDPLIAVERCYWLLRCRYQVLLLNPMLLFVLASLTNHLRAPNTVYI